MCTLPHPDGVKCKVYYSSQKALNAHEANSQKPKASKATKPKAKDKRVAIDDDALQPTAPLPVLGSEFPSASSTSAAANSGSHSSALPGADPL
jgi:hypothetical protein